MITIHQRYLLPRDAVCQRAVPDGRETLSGTCWLTSAVMETHKTIETQRIAHFTAAAETPGRRPGTRSGGHDS